MTNENEDSTERLTQLKGVASEAIAGSLKVTSHGPLPSDNPLYLWVGRIASEWSQVEHILDGIIWDMAEVNPVRGACITSQMMGVNPRCKAIIQLGRLYHGHERILDEAAQKSVKVLMNASYVLADLRARAVHDPWYFESVEGKPAQFKSMPYSDPRYGFVPVSEAEMAETLEKIRAFRDQTSQLAAVIRKRFETLRDTPAP